jgi:DNA modification methylase
MSVELICGDCFDVLNTKTYRGKVDLIVADVPYGDIVDEAWDVECYDRVGQLVESTLKPGGTAYIFGGAGTYRNRPFFKWLGKLEDEIPALKIHNLITWKKKRAYGVKDNYLWVREEIAFLVKGKKPKTFNIPLLDKLRGYEGYNAKYKAKSAFLRRTNVFDDITELLRNKIHKTEKPAKLIEVLVRTSSNKGDLVVDPFAGSGSTGVACNLVGGRRCVLIEKRDDCMMHPLE